MSSVRTLYTGGTRFDHDFSAEEDVAEKRRIAVEAALDVIREAVRGGDTSLGAHMDYLSTYADQIQSALAKRGDTSDQ